MGKQILNSNELYEKYHDEVIMKSDIMQLKDLYEKKILNKVDGDELINLICTISQVDASDVDHSDKKIPFYEVINFEKYLSKAAKKVYENKALNTVYEYILYKHKLFNINVKFFQKSEFKRIRVRDILFERYHKLLGFKRIPGLQAQLIQFISIEAKLDNEHSVEYYIKKLATLFNYLVKKKVVIDTVMQNVIIVHYVNPSLVCISIFCGVNKDTSKWSNLPAGMYVGSGTRYDNYNTPNDLNKLLGFDIFVYEGNSIKNFDWNLIDKLK